MLISLTQFVDVVARSGFSKYGKVQEVRQQISEDYSPGKDPYKSLREGIISVHKHGRGLEFLDQVLFRNKDTRRWALFEERVAAYKKWVGRKQHLWLEPQAAIYAGHGIDVRINPELGLVWRGKTYIIKLYFKREKLDLQAARLIGAMMKEALGEQHPDAVFAVLDVKHGKLREFDDAVDSKLRSIIDAELLYLARLLLENAAA